MGRMVTPRSCGGGSGLQEGLWVRKEVRSIGLSQGPGATFPEMCQAPAPLGFPEQRLGVENSTVEEAEMHRLLVLLELGELSRMIKVMGVEFVAIGLFCKTVGTSILYG